MSTTAPPERGISLEEAIQQFVKIQERYTELGEQKKQFLEVLIMAAQEARQPGSKTARLANYDQSIVLKAEFGEYVKCDVDALNVVKEMLGDDVFEELFKTEYKPKMRFYKPFMATKSTDERIETAKEEIRKAVTSSPESPRFTVEKS